MTCDTVWADESKGERGKKCSTTPSRYCSNAEWFISCRTWRYTEPAPCRRVAHAMTYGGLYRAVHKRILGGLLLRRREGARKRAEYLRVSAVLVCRVGAYYHLQEGRAHRLWKVPSGYCQIINVTTYERLSLLTDNTRTDDFGLFVVGPVISLDSGGYVHKIVPRRILES